MLNQAGGPCAIYGDIFSIREKVINDILLQNNLDKIRHRQVERLSSSKKKSTKKSKSKTKKVSDSILPKINFISYVNTNPHHNFSSSNKNNNIISNHFNLNSNSNNVSNILNMNSNRNRIAQIKNNIKDNNNNSSGLFLTNLNSDSNINDLQNQNTNKNLFNLMNSGNFNNNPLMLNENTNSIKPRSVISECNHFKFLFSYDDPNRESFLKRFLESKKRSNLNKLLEIEKENEFFIKKLKSVNSNLSRDKLNSSYARACEYKNIARKAKTNKELKERIDNKVIAHLPPIVMNRFSSICDYDNMLNNSRVVSNTYEG